MDALKFKDGRVHYRNSGVKGLNVPANAESYGNWIYLIDIFFAILYKGDNFL